MFKCSFLLAPGANQPFRLKGDDAANVAATLFPAATGYVQTSALPDQPDAGFSGVAEFFFDNPQAAGAAANSDIANLLNDGVEVQSTLAGMERVVMRGPTFGAVTKIKGVYPFCRRPDLSMPDFLKYWWQTHGPIAALTDDALAYVQIHPIADAGYERSYDGITEIYWPDIAVAAEAVVSRQMREDQGADAPNFVDLESIALFFAEEEIIIDC